MDRKTGGVDNLYQTRRPVQLTSQPLASHSRLHNQPFAADSKPDHRADSWKLCSQTRLTDRQAQTTDKATVPQQMLIQQYSR